MAKNNVEAGVPLSETRALSLPEPSHVSLPMKEGASEYRGRYEAGTNLQNIHSLLPPEFVQEIDLGNIKG